MRELCVIGGDGIGPEVTDAALAVLQEVVDVRVVRAEGGYGCFERCGEAMPAATLDQLRACGAGLFGATASPSRKVAGYRSAVLSLRQELDLYASLRPVYSLPGVSSRADVDLLVVRENTEGLYVGREHSDGETAVAERQITRAASTRIGALALRLAAERRNKLTIVHKANVLPLTCGLFRDSVRAEAGAFPEVVVEELLVDVAALALAERPQSFDVIVTTNLFGDILSDLACHWMGGLGLAPSLNFGEGIAVAEPVHGTAPDIVGRGLANPCAAILSAAMLLRYHWDMTEAAARIEAAVRSTLQRIPVAAGTQALLASVLADVRQGQFVARR